MGAEAEHDVAAWPVTPEVRDEIEAAYRSGLMTSPLPMVLVGHGGRIIAVNPEFERLLGYAEADVHGRTVIELAHEDDRPRVRQVIERMREHEPWRFDYEARWIAADGRVVWTRRHVFNVPGDGTRADHIVALLEDITDERLAQRQAAASVEVGRMIANGAELTEVAERLAAAAEERWSDVGCCLMLRDDDGDRLVAHAHGKLPADLFAELGPVTIGPEGGACGNAVWRAERVEIRDLSTDPRSSRFAEAYERRGLVSAWQVPVTDPLGTTIGAFGLIHRSPREASEADWSALETLAGLAGIAAHVDRVRRAWLAEEEARRYDTQTGLPTSQTLAEVLAAWDPAAPLSVLAIRLDNAAAVAAAAGDDAPSRLLQVVAARARSFGEIEAVGHLAPIALGLAVRGEWTSREAELLLRVLSRSVDLGSAAVKPQLRVSVVVPSASSRPAPDELLRQAAVALPRRGVAVQGAGPHRTASAALSRSSELRRALQQDEIVVHYQPQYDLASGAVVGCEALARWQHPEHGLLMPGEFLPAVELADLGSDLLLRVVAAVQRDAPQLRQAGVQGRVAVNVTAADLRREHVVATLTDPDTALWEVVDLELTETALVDEDARAALDALANAGYDIALDDFGTGWSSLSVMHTLPLAAVKVDRSFIQRLPDDPAVAALLHGVAATCRHLGITVFAEGIETWEQAAAARAAGCSVGQGYLLHRPTSLAGIDASPAEPPSAPPASAADARLQAHEAMRSLALAMAEEGASRHTIAAALNRAGYRTPAGVRWRANTVSSLLRSAAAPAMPHGRGAGGRPLLATTAASDVPARPMVLLRPSDGGYPPDDAMCTFCAEPPLRAAPVLALTETPSSPWLHEECAVALAQGVHRVAPH